MCIAYCFILFQSQISMIIMNTMNFLIKNCITYQNQKWFVNPYRKTKYHKMKIRIKFCEKWIRKVSKHWNRWNSTWYSIQKKKKWFTIEKPFFNVSLFLSIQCRLFLYILKFLTVVNRFFSIHLYVHFRKDFGLLF